MTVSDDRVELADPAPSITRRPPGSRAAPVQPPAGPGDLPSYLRATAARADADDLETAYRNCGTAIDAAVRWRSPAALAAAHSLRASVARRRGDLAAAAQDAELAARLLADRPDGEVGLLLLARRIAIALDRGDVAAAAALLGDRHGALPDGPGLALRYARARLYAATGRPGEALSDLFTCGERLAARQVDRPAVMPWRSAAATILGATGTGEAAVRLVAAEVGMARRSGPASALGRALRIAGTVPGGPGLPALEEAVRVLAGSPRRFEYARALTEFGAALNAARRRPQARRVLRDAVDLAAHCGSPALTDRARAAYAAAGGKPRPVVPAPRPGA
jgi:tetratricopeptide (TPR) repeat protein